MPLSQGSIDAATPQPRPHFAILMGVFPRAADPFYHVPEMTSLRSIASQTYPHWTLFITGDAVDAAESLVIREMLNRSDVPNHKWYFMRTRPGTSERWSLKSYDVATDSGAQLVWMHGGSGSSYKSFRALLKDPRFSHITHLAAHDDDDIWYNHHLELHAKAYDETPNASFVFSQGHNHPVGVLPPSHLIAQLPSTGSTTMEGSNRSLFHLSPPYPCYLVRATHSFRLASPIGALRYRQLSHQFRVRRSPHYWNPFKRCMFFINGLDRGYLPGDLDMYDQIWNLVEKKQVTSVAALNISGMHTTKEYKNRYLRIIKHSYCDMTAEATYRRWPRAYQGTPFLKRLIDGRRDRLRRLFWPHSNESTWFYNFVFADQSKLWTSATLFDHDDFLSSLSSYRRVRHWLQARSPMNDTSGERGEMLHVIRPLLDIACREGTDQPSRRPSCVYAEHGRYCGLAMGLALTLPTLDAVVQFSTSSALLANASKSPFSHCHDAIYRDKTGTQSLDPDLPKTSATADTDIFLNHFRTTHTTRLQCINVANAELHFQVPLPQPRKLPNIARQPGALAGKKNFESVLGKRKINLLLFGPGGKDVDELYRDFTSLSHLVAEGGVVILDEFPANAAIRRLVTRHLDNTMCKSPSWQCLGPFANQAKAPSFGSDSFALRNEDLYAEQFVIVRISANRNNVSEQEPGPPHDQRYTSGLEWLKQ